MASYKIPIFFEPFEKQKKAARLLHLLAGFLMIANAWGDYRQSTPALLFVVVQIAGALLAILFALAGKRLFSNQAGMNSIFRLAEAAILFYAASYFFGMNLSLMAMFKWQEGLAYYFYFSPKGKSFLPVLCVLKRKGFLHPITWATG